VTGCDEVYEILGGTEIWIDLGEVLSPVAVVAFWGVEDDGGDPDGVEAHAGDVVEVVDDALEAASAVVGEIGAGLSGAVGEGEAIGEELVDGSRGPLSFGGALGVGYESEEEE